MGTHRLHRVRWATHAHRAAARTVRDATALDLRGGLRTRHRGNQPPARTGLDTTRHLLRLAAARDRRRPHRRHGLHRARTGADHRAGGPVSRVTTGVGSRPRRRCRCRCPSRRRARRRRPHRSEPSPCRTPAPLGRLRPGRGGGNRAYRSLAGPRPPGLRRRRAATTAPDHYTPNAHDQPDRPDRRSGRDCRGRADSRHWRGPRSRSGRSPMAAAS